MAMHTYKKVVVVLMVAICCWGSIHSVRAADIAATTDAMAVIKNLSLAIKNATETIQEGVNAGKVLGAAAKTTGASWGAYFGAAITWFVGCFGVGATIGYWIGVGYERKFGSAVEIIPAPMLAIMAAEAPTPAMRLEFVTYTIEKLLSPRMKDILDDLIEKSRALLAKRNVTQDELNACLRWSILVSRVARGLNLLDQVIAAGANVNHMDRHGNTPMVIAIQFAMHNAVKKLLAKGVDLTVATAGVTPDIFARQRLHAAKRTVPSNCAFGLEHEAENILEEITRYKQEHNGGNDRRV